MSEQFDPETSERDLHSIGVASTLGFGIALSLAILAGGGVWLDTRFDTAPLWSLIGLLLGMIAAGYQLYELVLVSRRDKPNGPLGRKISSRRGNRSN
ncbi:MAG: AtpZ/AtpI family protein [Thermomicrobiales bacterium]|nr:AtpZ/AtpI family protein [Thermomicrobiales bacterium]MCO5219378.1 AtpZ/AtpI family protein [Thermomicrobiales bacterium]MCO5225234.1 AtpZ/AtpI family protein [Thermomicrobiales bacterium]MCO5227055.1 AtpZ/AtpI family protein [Thermomicrobiales bacterium]